ncbi:MAG: radical SAM protein [bacterium]
MRILFLYPRDNGEGQIPMGLSILCACLKQAGHTLKVFDTTFYPRIVLREMYESLGYLKKCDLREHGVIYHQEDPLEKFIETAREFQPDLIGLSAVTYSFNLGMSLIEGLRREGIDTPVIVGGTHPTIVPEEVIQHELVDMVCVGEGEEAVVELCSLLDEGHAPTEVRNIWYKCRKSGRIYRNPVRPLIALDKVPCPDWSYFSDMHLPRPFVGKVYRIGHVERSRGCPYQCSYCASAHMQKLYRGKGVYHREKSIGKVISELRYLREKHNIEMIRFWDDTFLAMGRERFLEFSDTYRKEIGLPFMISTRPETVTQERIAILKEMGVAAISMGIESGCERIRREVLNRKIKDETILRAFQIVREAGIRVTAFNMVGLPTETRKDVFKTIDLNRKARPDTTTANLMYPYPGTAIRTMCLDMGLVPDDIPTVDHNEESVLHLPDIDQEELLGLQRMFTFYTRVPRAFFPLVRICEKQNGLSKVLTPVLRNICFH